MTMLVQPRHIKLYYAGQAKNWRLAGFELNELRGALARIGRTIPTYRNIGVDTAVASIFANSIKSVDAAIKASDFSEIRRRLWGDDGGVQCLPHRHGASLPGHQGAGWRHLSRSGIQAVARPMPSV